MTLEIAPGYGQMLARARQAKGLTVAQVAEKLKLTGRQVEALEEEDLARLPAPVFVRGFIRNYARLVGVPLDSLPAIAEVEVAPTETITAPSEGLRFTASSTRRWLLLPVAALGLFVLLVVLLYVWLSQDGEDPAPAEAVAPVQALPAPAEVTEPAAVDPAAAPASVPATVLPEPAPVVVPPPPAPSAPPPPVPRASQAPAVQAAPAARPAASSRTRAVQLVAEAGASWVEVATGDGRREQRLLQDGERMTLAGVPPFQLLVGNAPVLRLSYDGRPVDLAPHTRERVARLTLE